MNCQAVQNQIIALADPRHLPPSLLAHVSTCEACQGWAQRAARLESMLKRLPVPSAPRDRKEALIGELMAADPVIRPMVAPAPRPSVVAPLARLAREHPSSIGGLAAAVLITVGLVWYGTRPRTVPHEFVESHEHPLLRKMVARDVALTRADGPAKRLEVLGGMAEDLAGETRGMARIAPSAELKDFARWYDKVVKDGMVRQVKELPLHMDAGEKRRLLDNLKGRLEADAAEADKLATEAPQDAQPTLKRMADTAREGARELSLAKGR
ncbi:hypothetical protein GobsT_16980 [Gemmata obscuriglobus]|uniref:Zinc-finger domain-containing protein n=1 Tax=Gemmata obscuriglobus TaxID=114 RepID=A0A2Z3HAA0_9BACT|nr:hypothetical protein [Gemmata obscuriglobus]AWM39915.1 hypothetical protein C1280_24855 [Gemmata obscuriglobus]QEG26950.1 hypothetical protein GobsT_16980 [Gemmata obscuriglobus]VTS03140.1 unnamed protein product [Gemmata obscuriglobus UQM 2246]